ncbi:hypothetical protein GCK32_003034, partial [Trichostrongylus colubriformis]
MFSQHSHSQTALLSLAKLLCDYCSSLSQPTTIDERFHHLGNSIHVRLPRLKSKMRVWGKSQSSETSSFQSSYFLIICPFITMLLPVLILCVYEKITFVCCIHVLNVRKMYKFCW